MINKKKKNIFVYTFPASGHVYPLLNLSKKIVEWGYNVVIYSIDKFKGNIQEINCKYREYDGEIINAYLNFEASSGDFYSIVDYAIVSSKKINKYLEIINKDKPDLIIHDAMCYLGKRLGEIANIKTICSVTTFAVKPTFFGVPFFGVKEKIHLLFTRFPSIVKFKLNEYINSYKYKTKIGKIFNLYYNYEKLNVVYTARCIQPLEYKFDNKFIFIGSLKCSTSECREYDYLNDIGKKVIYISFGTIFFAEDKIYKICLEAFKGKEYEVIFNIGKYENEKLFTNIPNNIKVVRVVNQFELLKKVSVFITHGGMNSVMESLICHVPMVLIPIAADQPAVAKQMHQMQVGIELSPKYINVSKLLEAIETVLLDSKYKERCAHYGRILSDKSGLNLLKYHIEDYISSC